MNNIETILKEQMIESWFAKQPAHGLDDVVANENFVRHLQNIVQTHSPKFQKFAELLQLDPKLSTYFFYGEVGVGASYMARAFAHELVGFGYMYMDVKGSQFHSKYVGEGEKNIVLLFKEAVKHAPCVLLIDEVEEVCGKRFDSHMTPYRNSLTNAFLGAYHDSNQSNIIVIGVTNHPLKVDSSFIDHARLICVDAPNLKANDT